MELQPTYVPYPAIFPFEINFFLSTLEESSLFIPFLEKVRSFFFGESRELEEKVLFWPPLTFAPITEFVVWKAVISSSLWEEWIDFSVDSFSVEDCFSVIAW